MDRIFFSVALIAAAVLSACNSPMQSKEERAAKDSANAPVQGVPEEKTESTRLDTTYGDYRISAIAIGNSSMRDLMLAIGSKKDSSKADSTIEKDIKGELKNLMVGDLDGNGKPELYLQTVSEGTGQYGKIYAFDLSSKPVVISTFSLDTMKHKAYQGRDSFFIKGKTLMRTFPLSDEGEPGVLTTAAKGSVSYQLQKMGDTLKLVPAK